MTATYIKTTLDGRKVEVIDGWICLAGVREADCLIPMDEHPNRQAIGKAVPGATHGDPLIAGKDGWYARRALYGQLVALEVLADDC